MESLWHLPRLRRLFPCLISPAPPSSSEPASARACVRSQKTARSLCSRSPAVRWSCRRWRKLRAAGTRRFLINTHHCPEAWTLAFPDGRFGDAEVKLVHEPVLLETGGGLANIAGPARTRTTRTSSSGTATSSPVATSRRPSRITAPTAAKPRWSFAKPGPNRNVRVTDEGAVTDLRDRLGQKPTLLTNIPASASSRRPSPRACPRRSNRSSNISSVASQAQPGSIQGFLDGSATWHDLGTIEEYQAVKALQEKPVRGAIASGRRG